MRHNRSAPSAKLVYRADADVFENMHVRLQPIDDDPTRDWWFTAHAVPGHSEGPSLDVDVKRVEDALIITRLTITASDGGTVGIDSATVRAVRVGAVVAHIRRCIVEMATAPSAAYPRLPGPADDPEWRAHDAQQTKRRHADADWATQPPRKRGRKGYGDDFFRDIALRYLELQQGGMTRGILRQLATEHDRPVETVRDWVHQARRREFLTPGQRGKAGALRGPRLALPDGDRSHDST